MRKVIFLLFCWGVCTWAQPVLAQCSICTRSAQQMGPQAAAGLNSGVIYLLAFPILFIVLALIYIKK